LTDVTPVDNLIVVFISSNQNEFKDLRKELKDAIDEATLFDKFLMKAELVELRGGERISGDITRALKDAAIYVGVFGDRYSKKTIEEYRQARRQGIPLLVFDIVPKRRDHQVKAFLEKQVKTLDDCRITTLRPSEMLKGILQRIANEVAEIAQQNLEIRRSIHPQ